MRIGHLVWLSGFVACAPAQAGMASAKFGVSARVLEQCTIQAASRSASCSSNSGYQLAVAREKLSTRAKLTGIAEPAQILSSNAPSPGSGGAEWGASLVSVDRAASLAGRGALARTARFEQPAGDEVEAVRVTFSF